jgi:transcriptional regulator with XRE-family HTH domain
MKISSQNTDNAILKELGARLTRSRLNRNLTQAQLANEAGVSKRTVERIEAGHSTQLSNLIRVSRALGLLVNFNLLIPEPIPSPIEQLKLRGKVRERASTSSRTTGVSSDEWTWGDET